MEVPYYSSTYFCTFSNNSTLGETFVAEMLQDTDFQGQ
jgi:hypothetical protein